MSASGRSAMCCTTAGQPQLHLRRGRGAQLRSAQQHVREQWYITLQLSWQLLQRSDQQGQTATSTLRHTARHRRRASATTSGAGSGAPLLLVVYQGFGANPVFAISTLDYSFFAQDNWKMNPRLTLELGVRYDYEFLPSPVEQPDRRRPTGFTPYAQVTNHPSDKNNVGPRVGFSYDVYRRWQDGAARRLRHVLWPRSPTVFC